MIMISRYFSRLLPKSQITINAKLQHCRLKSWTVPTEKLNKAHNWMELMAAPLQHAND